MFLVAFLIATLLYFLLLFSALDPAQRFLYDQVVDGLWWRSLLSAAPLGLLAILFPCRFDTMFTEQPMGLVFQVLGWFLVLWLVCQFQRVHAFVLGLVGAALFTWMVTMAADSLLGPTVPTP